jgi:hypothetical protein
MNIEDANKMTVQEACDFAVSNIVVQGKRCVRNANRHTCMYGNASGNHCSIGWLLDETNKELMDIEAPLHDLLKVHKNLIPKVIINNVYTFELLQGFHDATSTKERAGHLMELEQTGSVDTSAPHWAKWVDIGEGCY